MELSLAPEEVKKIELLLVIKSLMHDIFNIYTLSNNEIPIGCDVISIFITKNK